MRYRSQKFKRVMLFLQGIVLRTTAEQSYFAHADFIAVSVGRNKHAFNLQSRAHYKRGLNFVFVKTALFYNKLYISKRGAVIQLDKRNAFGIAPRSYPSSDGNSAVH